MSNYSGVGIESKIANAAIGRFTVIACDVYLSIGDHPAKHLTAHYFLQNNPWGFYPKWVNEIDNK